ncbi:hypothetical protein GBF35_50425 [Nonomuraea phyllanthi]|uniref:hypothetical protein n=1 Tax=Nonomuraea phyllanthi TaxID=2219224 RepID=UPI001293F2DF|nr:hypothetical protein [Nonomuraea phyllanthi]QFY13698.1 hypothetical protein GBF35_50425 [Nonomuraea phyllanthi]
MSTPWYVVKYMPDLYRREPRNVGVVLLDDDGGLARFYGQDPETGEVIPNWAAQLVPETRTYQQWVHYFVHHVGRGSWSRVLETLQRRRSFDNFYVEEGGSYEREYDDPQSAIEDLFRSLVTDAPMPAQGASSPELRSLVKRVFELAHVDKRVEKDPEYEVAVDGPRHQTHAKIRFDYRFVNGKTTLMERVPLSLEATRTNSEKVDALLYRIERVIANSDVEDFVAFYHVPDRATEEQERALEPTIRRLEAYADALDVGDVSFAARNLRQRLGVGK